MSTSFDLPTTTDPRYPIGRWNRAEEITPSMREEALEVLGELPQRLREALEGLHGEQLMTPYRDGGWTVQQLVHHVADSHMNAYIRTRFALTEDQPAIRAYDEKEWAELPDAVHAPVEWSLELLEALHGRWVYLLRSLDPAQWERTYVHPQNGPMTIERTVQLYAWHSRHHVAHVTHMRANRGW